MDLAVRREGVEGSQPCGTLPATRFVDARPERRGRVRADGHPDLIRRSNTAVACNASENGLEWSGSDGIRTRDLRRDGPGTCSSAEVAGGKDGVFRRFRREQLVGVRQTGVHDLTAT